MNTHELICMPWVGASEKLRLYSDPEAMRDELLKEQFYNLLGGLLFVYNFFAFIQNQWVQSKQKKATDGVEGETDPYESIMNNTTLRHRTGWN